ncbi:hypothetical protein M427DRAFT_455258 [Gonapodya prolifera JEL478]|uniref:Uncharacterized protein n=1 Tax=Gonapodya prolifera (strain JEL478) TaxID=1344416 RepID=A0A139A2I5_GONPJ|nr:hypothetical protein M427DRAFT_455258 [Gonapodya prolifera JEL478]|eukprot:KXS10996.1 hypothetical protein M427DRAFT_455258 [Gonapodya prolifera JEL478]
MDAVRRVLRTKIVYFTPTGRCWALSGRASHGWVESSESRPWKMNSTRKRNVRKRLREVDDVVSTLVESGVNLRALEEAQRLPTANTLSPKEKYFVFSRRSKTDVKGLHLVPHFTKVPHPRGLPGITSRPYFTSTSL